MKEDKYLTFPVKCIPELIYNTEQAVKEILSYPQDKIKGTCTTDARESKLVEFASKNKPTRQKELFAMSLAIKSTLGKEQYTTHVNSSQLIARFMGFDSYKMIDASYMSVCVHGTSNDQSTQTDISELYQKYFPFDNSTRDRRRRLINSACNKWHINRYVSWTNNGYSFSIYTPKNRMTLSELVYQVKWKREQNKNNSHQEQIARAEKDADDRLTPIF